MADSCWYLAENNKILWSNYPSVKELKKKKNLTNELILFFSNENLREKAGRQDRLKEYKFKVNFALG